MTREALGLNEVLSSRGYWQNLTEWLLYKQLYQYLAVNADKTYFKVFCNNRWIYTLSYNYTNKIHPCYRIRKSNINEHLILRSHFYLISLFLWFLDERKLTFHYRRIFVWYYFKGRYKFLLFFAFFFVPKLKRSLSFMIMVFKELTLDRSCPNHSFLIYGHIWK